MELQSLCTHVRLSAEIESGFVDRHSLVLQKAHFPSLEVTLPQVAAAIRAAVPLISCVLMEATQSEYAEATFERCAEVKILAHMVRTKLTSSTVTLL
ncbi:unnamed protein product [Sphagnum jensenii]|uniref:Uncharacterized protein n=1 Tax=Sphagnum jensenii TaxID=128206 RepID=A0ABP1C3H3_9BRYO